MSNMIFPTEDPLELRRCRSRRLLGHPIKRSLHHSASRPAYVDVGWSREDPNLNRSHRERIEWPNAAKALVLLDLARRHRTLLRVSRMRVFGRVLVEPGRCASTSDSSSSLREGSDGAGKMRIRIDRAGEKVGVSQGASVAGYQTSGGFGWILKNAHLRMARSATF